MRPASSHAEKEVFKALRTGLPPGWTAWHSLRLRDAAPWLIFLHVEVIGPRAAESRRRIYRVSHTLDWGQEGTGRITGVCAGVGAQLLGRHGRTQAGFVDPEVYYDPAEFLDELAKRGTVTVACEEDGVAHAVLERTD